MLPVKPRTVPRVGNSEVVDMLKRWLARAEQGRLGFVVIVACEDHKRVVSNHAGTLELAFSANWGLDTAKLQIMERLHSRHMQPYEPDNSAGADRVCWNISTGPACFDFLVSLIIAEMNRRRDGAPAPLKVGFTMDDSDKEQQLHALLRKQMYEGVIYPSLAFVGAVVDEKSQGAPEIDKYTIAPIVEYAKAGEEVPLLTPSKNAVETVSDYLKGQAPVTITLREAKYVEHRNSNLTEWLKVAEYLEAQGEKVIFIRDTAKADEPITGFETYPAASVNLDTRLALYEAAKCNLFVSNGPWYLGLFGTRPWLMFVELDPISPYFGETHQFYLQWHGVDALSDEQFPWSTPQQRVIYKRDNADNIIKAWEALGLNKSNIIEFERAIGGA